MVVALVPDDDPILLRDQERLEAVKQARGESEHELMRTRFNKNGPLLRLGRLRRRRHCLRRLRLRRTQWQSGYES